MKKLLTREQIVLTIVDDLKSYLFINNNIEFKTNLVETPDKITYHFYIASNNYYLFSISYSLFNSPDDYNPADRSDKAVIHIASYKAQFQQLIIFLNDYNLPDLIDKLNNYYLQILNKNAQLFSSIQSEKERDLLLFQHKPTT
jgi:hypothetical protein